MPIRARVLGVCSALFAVLFLLSSVSLYAQDKKDKKDQPKYSKDQIEEVRILIALTDEVVTAKQPAPADIAVSFHQHFMRSREGKTFVPYTLAIDPSGLKSPNLLLYVLAVKKGETVPAPPKAEEGDQKPQARAEYPWEEYSFVDLKTIAAAPPAPYRITRYIGVAPGEYDVYVAVRERSASGKKEKNAPLPKTTVLKQAVTAPDFNTALSVSSVIVIEKVEDLAAPLPEAALKENPYTFGTMKLTPALAHKFTKKDEISWIFVVYNAQLDATTKKPDVTIEYNFHQKTKDGEKYFNKTSPQSFNAQTLPPQWDGVVMNQISAGQSVPLASFPEGDYRLEVKIVDKLGNKTIAESVNFSVAAGS